MEDLYKKLIDTIPVFFFLWDSKKRETVFISEKFYNHRSKKYFSPDTPKENLRQYIHDESLEAYDQFFASLAEDNTDHEEIELKAADNLPEIAWMKLNTYPVTQDDNTNKFIAGHISDITYSKENHEVLREQVDSLDTVTFMLAHELSAPIANIMGLAELLKAKVGENDQKNYLNLYDTIYNFGGEVLTVARGLISLIELQAQQQELKLAPCELKALLEELVEEFYFKTDSSSSNLTFEGLNDSLKANLHSEKFTRAVEELLTYLLKHSKHEQQIRIKAEQTRGDKDVLLLITAEQLQLPAKQISSVLDRATRLNMIDVRGTQVRGMLELVIAKEIVELHHGKLSFYNENGTQGFAIILPKLEQEVLSEQKKEI